MTTAERLRALAREAEQIAEQIESGEQTPAQGPFGVELEPVTITEDNWREQEINAEMDAHLEALGYVPPERADRGRIAVLSEVERRWGREARETIESGMD